jgi:REP-associated tyrosine transposase
VARDAYALCMPRKPRTEEPGAIHHVFARGNDRRTVFIDDADRRRYLEVLGTVVRRQRWLCLSYCLMDNHVHLLIETPEPNLGAGMQRLHGLYAQDFNERHGRSGHVFQGRYGAVRVRSDEQFWTAAAYVVRNPVAAGLCARPEDWPWSSHRATLHNTRESWFDPRYMLQRFEMFGPDPQRRYADATAA